MTGSVPIVDSSVADAPKDYAIKAGQVIELLGIRASFTDNGASGDWLPQIEILDNNGNVLSHASDQGVKVTAGGDADVSWFPGVKHAASATSSGALQWAWIDSQLNQVISANGGSGSVTSGVDMDPATLYTNAASLYGTGSKVTFGGTFHGLTFKQTGHYEVIVMEQPLWDGTFPAGGNGALYEVLDDNPTGIATFQRGVPTAIQTAATIHDQLGHTLVYPVTVTGAVLPTQPLIYGIQNYTNTSWHHSIQYWVKQLDTDPSFLG